MPYTEKNLPGWVKQKLPKKAQAIWLASWNSANKEYNDEKTAFRVAITTVKKAGYVKDDKKDKYVLKKSQTSKNIGETTSNSLDPKGMTVSSITTKKRKKSYSKYSEYEGRKVPLNKPFRTLNGPKKFAVYVTNDKGNVIKVNFGDPNMSIKRDNPERRKSFRARHNCSDKTDKTKPGYWSCRFWSDKPVSKILKAESLKEDYNKMGCKKEKKMSKFVKWSTAYKNSLPDSAFAVVYKEDDKTVRKLPYKDQKGKIDVPHLRNAMARLPQSDLKPTIRAKAMKTLKNVAGRYLESYQTKSAKYMQEAIAKYKQEDTDKVEAIIQTLKELAGNKKPDEDVHITVKSISYLIDDLEGIKEYLTEDAEEEPKPGEENDEESDTEQDTSKEEETDPDKSDVEKEPETKDEKVEEKPEESKDPEPKSEEVEKDEPKKDDKETEEDDEEDTETSKFQEIIKICEGYQTELKNSEQVIAKYQEEIKSLKKEKEQLTEQVSKFKQETYDKILNETVEKVSKFKNLSESDSQQLKKDYLEKGMSVSALEEIGRMVGNQEVSKWSDPKPTTQPTELVNETESQEQSQEVSKLSASEKLDQLAKLNAKANGFVEY